MKPTVSVIVVARNEQATIEEVIREIVTVLPKVAGRYEVLVNEDASTDRTPAIVDSLHRRFPEIRVFHQKKPIGIAHGMEFLYKRAKMDYVFTLSGDGQYTANDLPPMLAKAREGFDVVVGKRINKKYTLERNIVSFLFNTLSFLFFGVDTIDAGSIKLYRMKILRKFTLTSRGVYNEAERIIRAAKAGYRIGWVPVRHMRRQGGHASGAKLSLIWEAVVDMLRLWWLLRIACVSPITLR